MRVIEKRRVHCAHFDFKAPLRFAPNRCGEDCDKTQYLRGFAQNPYAQLLRLGLVLCCD
jgi:hypothetical protein